VTTEKTCISAVLSFFLLEAMAAAQSIGSLTFVDNAPGTPQTVVLTGTGYIYAFPQINNPLVPSSQVPGGTDFTLTVNGTGFYAVTEVRWNGAALPTTFVSATQLTAGVPAADIAAAGTALVTAVNPAPGGGTSNAAVFEITTGATTLGFSKRDVATGNNPTAVAEGDFNGDGKLDVAVTNGGDNTVSILLGAGDGTFQPAGTFATGLYPGAVAAGDFNKDGKLDLAVANISCPLTGGGCQSASVSILLGNGDGTFQAQTKVATGFTPNDIVVGDFNGDGALDFAVVDDASTGSFTGGAVTVFLGNGDGTFKAGVDYPADAPTHGFPYSLVAADFNGDGKLDIAVSGGPSFDHVGILIGNGDGTFQTPVMYATGAVPYGIATGDCNGDGKLDLATANYGSGTNTVSVLLGNGDGTFQSHVDDATGVGPASLTLGDFNGDGKLDIAAANVKANTVSVLLGNGDGTFQVNQDFPTDVTPFGIVASDFDGDGKLDLGIATYGSNNLTVLTQAPLVSLSASSLNFAAQTAGTASAAQTVTITNSGGVPLIISNIALTGTNPGDFTLDSNCVATFAVGGSCTASITFKPAAGGTRSAALTVTDNVIGGSQTVALSGTGQDFAVSAADGTVSVSAGSSVTDGLQVSPQGGFTGTVTLACSGAPSKSTCIASPSSVTLDGTNNASATLKVTTTASSTAAPVAAPPQRVPPVAFWLGLLALLCLAALAFACSGDVPIAALGATGGEDAAATMSIVRRFRLATVLAAALILAAVGASCGGGGGTSHTTIPGTPAGTYTLTVTATSGSLSNTTTVTLTVR
jgi:hypothetical protein